MLKTIEIKNDGKAFGVKRGELYVVIKEYFRNGEAWMKAVGKEKKIVTFPSVFTYNIKMEN